MVQHGCIDDSHPICSSFRKCSKHSHPPTGHPLTLAVIADYGDATPNAADVAALVKSWQPDYIITAGDNNYPIGAAETIDTNIGQFFSEYIYPYHGTYTPGQSPNRFYPALGNHDVMSYKGQPYFDYFELPGNERYYDVDLGAVHLYVLNSNDSEPDGFRANSVQADWLKQQLALHRDQWNLVVLHDPPYSSGHHGSASWLRWPFKEWGADLVISGHDHSYERLVVDDLTYVVNGLGGQSFYLFNEPLPESIIRYRDDNGALKITADANTLHGAFITRKGEVIDEFTSVWSRIIRLSGSARR